MKKTYTGSCHRGVRSFGQGELGTLYGNVICLDNVEIEGLVSAYHQRRRPPR